MTMQPEEPLFNVLAINDMEELYLACILHRRDITLSEVFQYELSPVPSALIDEHGDIRKRNKALLFHKLAVFSKGSLTRQMQS